MTQQSQSVDAAAPPVANWIDLNDPSGAKLKLATIEVDGRPVPHLFIRYLAWVNPRWQAAVRELGFREGPGRQYLVRVASSEERITLAQVRKVFPAAKLAPMHPKDYILGYGKTPRKDEARSAQLDFKSLTRLGRNADGDEVYSRIQGRLVVDAETGDVSEEGAEGVKLSHEAFLRLAPLQSAQPEGAELQSVLSRLALGLVQAMRRGEVLHSEDVRGFARAVFAIADDEQPTAEVMESVWRALDEALLLDVRSRNDTPALAYGESARLHAYQPGYVGEARGGAAVPLPLSIVAQRLLGDTAGKTVVVPQVWDGALVSFLSPDATVRAFQPEGAQHLRYTMSEAWPLEASAYTPAVCAGADAVLINVDPQVDELGQRLDLRLASQSIRQLRDGARAVLLLAADEGGTPGVVGHASAEFMQQLAQRYVIDDVWETAPILSRKSGGTHGIRLVALRASAPTAEQVDAQVQALQQPLRVFASWDSIKAHVDERIEAINLAEAKSRLGAEDRQDVGVYQRPYLAFSRLGEARTMVPANLQAPTQQYLTSLEAQYGPVDEFVSRELGMGMGTLAKRFSPEQMDGVSIMISRLLLGRSSILADDTGIGKGRQLAAMATWANKRGEDVFFVTDRANLFSDLARDLTDIGEWGRFSPLVINSDGEVSVDMGPGQPPRVLAQGESAASMARFMEAHPTLRDGGRNLCFLTYSQINTEESAKAQWLKGAMANGLVIFDEAHVAAGSDSNMARHVLEMASVAKHVQFASATWAKTPDNMHIFQRAMPMSVSMATLADTMRKGGESFSEIFSAMLASEGGLIRREHDLSRLEVNLVVDEQGLARNQQVSDKIADVLGAAAYLAGEMEQVFIRTNADSVRTLKQARDARDAFLPRKAKLFASNFGGGSVIYQVLKGMQGALNADHVARLTIDALKAGEKPVVVSDATGEALLQQLLDSEAEQQEVGPGEHRVVRMPTLQDLVRSVVVKRLSTVRVREVGVEDLPELDDESADPRDVNEASSAAGDAGAVDGAQPAEAQASAEDESSRGAEAADVLAVSDAWRAAQSEMAAGGGASGRSTKAGKAKYVSANIFDAITMTPEAREAYERGMKELEVKVAAIPKIPVSAIDVIEQAWRDAGYRVGEITGRSYQLIADPVSASSGGVTEGGGGPAPLESYVDRTWRLHARVKNKRAVKATIKAFNDGVLDAAVLNRSAAAGVSMHSSPRFGDRRRRHLVEHMIPEDPVNRVQLLGRVNRFDQLSTPRITTASTGIYGEVRYLMMQNRKLARMSANVRSSRDNAMSLKGVVDLFNTLGLKAVRSYLRDNPLVAARLGFEGVDLKKVPDLVNRTTMRIPLLTVAQQEVVYSEINSRFEEELVRAEVDGNNPLKPEELDVRAKVVSESVFIGEEAVAGEDDDALTLSAFDAPVMMRRLRWEENRKPLPMAAVLHGILAARQVLASEGVIDLPVRVMDEETDRVNSDAEEFLALESANPSEVLRSAEVVAESDQDAVDEDEESLVDDAGDGEGASSAGDDEPFGDLFAGREEVNEPLLSGGAPMLSPKIVDAVLRASDALLRAAVLRSGKERAEDALGSDVVFRAYITHRWLKNNLHKLVPGARVSWTQTEMQWGLSSEQRSSVVMNVRPPIDRAQWMNFGQWRLTLVSAGDERGREVSLRYFMSEVEGHVLDSVREGEKAVFLTGPRLTHGVYDGGSSRFIRGEFNYMSVGRQVRTASMLCGNLYLASEWAAATGKGRPVLYTDDSGQRHRGILLPRDLEHVSAENMPVRVHDTGAQARLFRQLMVVPESASEGAADDPANLPRVLDLTFRSAMARIRTSSLYGSGGQRPDAVMVLVPGVGIGMSLPGQDAARVTNVVRSGLKAYVAEHARKRAQDSSQGADLSAIAVKRFRSLKGAPAPMVQAVSGIRLQRVRSDSVLDPVAETKLSKAGLLYIRAVTPEEVDAAVRVISESAGLEVYAAQGEVKMLARQALSESVRERRQQLREARDRARAQIDAQIQAVTGQGQSQEASEAMPPVHPGSPGEAEAPLAGNEPSDGGELESPAAS